MEAAAGPPGLQGSVDVAGSGKNYQTPQRFRNKCEKSRQQQFHNHKETANTREEVNLNNLFTATRHTLPIHFPLSPGPVAGPIGLGQGGVVMFPAPNGHMITKIGPYKEPLLPSGPPPLLQHHGGLNLGPLAFAHHANVKAAMQAMGMFSPPHKKDLGLKFPPTAPPESPKLAPYSAVDMHKARIHSCSASVSGSMGPMYSRSTSTSSVGNLCTVHDASLKKLMKDLYRCEVSIARYQTMLNEHCDAGLRFLHQAFITLHIGLNAREKDIARELQMTRQTAGTILQHRHATACVLRQLAERAGELEETQLHELKKQIKQFVVDRKVDEEIGTTSRFIADPDDLLPHVMKFGRVVNRRHVYTSWEGDPATAVEKSKHTSRSSASVFSSPTSSLPTTPTSPGKYTATTTAKSSSQESFDRKLEDDSVFIGNTQECDGNSTSLDSEMAVNDGCGSEQRKSLEEQMVDHLGGQENEDVEEEGRSSKHKGNVKVHAVAGSHRTPYCRSVHSSEQAIEKTEEDSSSLRSPQGTLTSPSSLSSSSSSLDSKLIPPATAVPCTAKPVVTAAPSSHKGRSQYSRKFATPIVVTHTRRSFGNKPLPKNLDPKSTVTLLLSSSSSTPPSTSQQKHSKHKNQKSFKQRQFSPSRNSSEGGPEETSSTVSSVSTPSLSLRLRGREKERELWRKRFNSSGNGGSREQGRGTEEGSEGAKLKWSPEELSAIQSRVRESLRAQGVFLYDPVTGAVPIDMKGEENGDSGLGKSEPHQDSIKMAADLKKKTPTQLRRERKKRQRERERRQKELERRVQEEGEKRGGGGRILLLDKTSTEPSASTSRTTSPLSSNVSDTRTESASLSLSQSPPPSTDPVDKTGERGDKPMRSGGGGGEEDRYIRSKDVKASLPACSYNNLTSYTGIEMLNVTLATDHPSDVKNPESSSSTVVSPDSKIEDPLLNGHSASIEWDLSQKRKEAHSSSISTPLVSSTQAEVSPLKRNQYRDVVVNEFTEEEPHCSTDSVGNSNFIKGVDHSSSLSSFNQIPNETVLHQISSHQHHISSPPTVYTEAHTELTSMTSAIQSNDKTRPPSLPTSTTSDTHISEAQLRNITCNGSKLQQNGADTFFVINGHEE